MAHVVVAGGGIAGLATALSTAGSGPGRRSHTVTVLERDPGFTELGAGIQLAPNAIDALDAIGVADPVLERAVHVPELRLMNYVDGRTIATLPLGARYRMRFGAPYVVVHRTDLYQPLVEACQAHPAITLRPGHTVTGYEQDDTGVAAVLGDGTRIIGDVLVGADGLRSAVRRQMLDDGDPPPVGHTTYRSVVPIEQVPPNLELDAVTLWAGPRRHLVHYPIAGGRFLNIAATVDNGATSAASGRPVPAASVLAAFPGATDSVNELLQVGGTWRSWTLCDRDPTDRWNDGRVVLIGDAAHPMLQYAAQGACIALEDAVTLGAVLRAEDDDPSATLQWFTEMRTPRAGRVQRVARAMGTQVYHPAGDAAHHRDARFAGMTPSDMYDALDWLHGNTR